MTNQLTQQQIEWAKSHDWFHGIDKDGMLVVVDRYVFEGRCYETFIVWVNGFNELRDWAVY